MCGITKVGTLRNAEKEFSLQRYLTRCGLSRRRNDFWTLVSDDARDDHELKRHKDSQDSARTPVANDDTVPMAQEPSSGSGVKRSKHRSNPSC